MSTLSPQSMAKLAAKARWEKLTPVQRSRIMKKVRKGKKQTGGRGTKPGRRHP